MTGGEYSLSGTILGTPPMAGINIETSGISENVTIQKVKVSGNKVYGIALSSGTTNTVVEDCLLENNSLFESVRSGIRNNTIRNNTFKNTGINAHGGGTYIDDNKFYFDKNAIGSYLSAISSDDQGNMFFSSLSRKGRIKGNHIFCDLTDLPPTISVLGCLTNIGNNVNDVTDNVVINAFSKTATAVVGGTPDKFINNTFIYNGVETAIGVVKGGNVNYENTVNGKYSLAAGFEYYSDTRKKTLGNEKYAQKAFYIPQASRVPTDKCFDIIINGPIEADIELIKLTINAGANIKGSSVIYLQGPSKFNQNLFGYGSDRLLVTQPYLKNGNMVVTIKGNFGTEGTEATYGFQGSVIAEFYTNTSKPVSDINMSAPYVYTT